MSSVTPHSPPPKISLRRPSANVVRPVVAPVALLSPGSASVSEAFRSTKRRPIGSELLSPRRGIKRIREATPICESVEDATTSGGGVGMTADQNASAPAYTTTGAGPSSYRLDDGGEKGVTSEAGEPEGSVLFSEQAGKESKEEEGQGEEEAFEDEATNETEGFLPEEFDDGNGHEDQVALDENFDTTHREEIELEESQDANDLEEAPPWLDDPNMPTTVAQDRMSLVLDRQAGSQMIEKEDEEEEEDEAGPNSYHSGDTEDFEMEHRPVLERTAVKWDIKRFVDGIAHAEGMQVNGEVAYKVVDRLGEGTFSSVYLAHDLFHELHDNSWWTGREPVRSIRALQRLRSDTKVALKKILATSSPARIENELHILESLRGCRNVSQIITAFREEDQVIIVLPYHRSDDFRFFYKHMDPPHIQQYMRALFRALKDIHKRGIIHRDVKPANFLFDYETGEGVLCDFGLAERYVPQRRPTCQHTTATISKLHGSKVKTSETPIIEQAWYDARKRSKLGEGRVGFLHEDKRPSIKTNRAGTRGFRAPEVLLKCPDQSVAIDVWSAGIMLLAMLAHKFPVFNSNDDIEALMEIATVFGKQAMERCALLHNRTIICNVPSIENPRPLKDIILHLNPHIYTPMTNHPSRQDAEAHIKAVDSAIELCVGLLRLDPTRRLTAEDALRHPFLAPEPDDEVGLRDLQSYELLDGTEGKCGNLHDTFEDDKHRAYFGEELSEMVFGQGIPTSRYTRQFSHYCLFCRTSC
ncbi:kinase-like domain-containing protein [Naematelia encephala]|uniref:non-specific serine/threonine protein kinase n=1 Tax=Naematelia encephala TaxID=71784 RepID=A0A1Y2AVK8_9TREE|nr:kinase-like domain-containing protein [Naematelia encephala]